MAEPTSIKEIAPDWLRVLYAETWKLYIYEDTVAQTRATIFTAVLAAIVALLGALSIQVVKIPCLTIQSSGYAPGVVVLGLLWFSVSFLMERLTTSFDEATKSGQSYVNLRAANLRVIEELAEVGILGPASFEDLWRAKSKTATAGAHIDVLPDIPRLAKLATIRAYSFAGGFRFFADVVVVFRKINGFLRYGGIALILSGAFGYFLKFHDYVPLCP